VLKAPTAVPDHMGKAELPTHLFKGCLHSVFRSLSAASTMRSEAVLVCF
jgi:hypothetical protein